MEDTRNTNNEEYLQRLLGPISRYSNSSQSSPIEISFPVKRSREGEKGYEHSIFLEAPREEYLCGFCKLVAKIPLECRNCGNLFCARCLPMPSRHFRAYSEFQCPSCSEALVLKEPSRILKNFIKELPVRCKYHARGCNERLTLGSLPYHKKCCDFKSVACANCEQPGNAKEFLMVRTQLDGKSILYVCSDLCSKEVKFNQLLKNKKLDIALEMYYEVLVQKNKQD